MGELSSSLAQQSLRDTLRSFSHDVGFSTFETSSSAEMAAKTRMIPDMQDSISTHPCGPFVNSMMCVAKSGKKLEQLQFLTPSHPYSPNNLHISSTVLPTHDIWDSVQTIMLGFGKPYILMWHSSLCRVTALEVMKHKSTSKIDNARMENFGSIIRIRFGPHTIHRHTKFITCEGLAHASKNLYNENVNSNSYSNLSPAH